MQISVSTAGIPTILKELQLDRRFCGFQLAWTRYSGIHQAQFPRRHTLPGGTLTQLYSQPAFTPKDIGPSHSIHHPFDFILGSAAVAKTMHEIMELAILCHSLDVGPVFQLSRPPYGMRIHLHLHAEGKCLSADTLMDSAWIFANKTRLVVPFYDGYIYP